MDLSFAHPEVVARFLVGLYSQDYCDYPNMLPAQSLILASKRLAINALVYALADKLRVDSIKKVAFAKIKNVLQIKASINGFIMAGEIVWTSVSKSDDLLRPYYFEMLKENRYMLFQSMAFQTLVRASEQLTADIFSLMVPPPELPKPSELFWCARCKGLGKDNSKWQDLKCTPHRPKRPWPAPRLVSRFTWELEKERLVPPPDKLEVLLSNEPKKVVKK